MRDRILVLIPSLLPAFIPRGRRSPLILIRTFLVACSFLATANALYSTPILLRCSIEHVYDLITILDASFLEPLRLFMTHDFVRHLDDLVERTTVLVLTLRYATPHVPQNCNPRAQPRCVPLA